MNNTIDPNTGNYLRDQIRYIVLCKGIPLKIWAGDPYWNYAGINVAVDALLCLLKTGSNNNPDITTLYLSSRIPNPYKYQDIQFNFNHRFNSNYYINGNWTLSYLVTRLDGQSLEEIQLMIDRHINADKTGEGIWILDGDPAYSSHTSDVTATKNILENYGFQFDYDTGDFCFETSDDPVIGYTSQGLHTGDNPPYWPRLDSGYVHNQLQFEYLNGAIFNTYESFNYHSNYAIYGRDDHGLVSEFVMRRPSDLEAGTGGNGHTWEPFISGAVLNQFYFPAYAMGYSVVDATYLGMPYLGWQNVVAGDPLTTIAWGKQTLTQNTEWTGTNLVTGNITIPSGKTLTIDNNAVINFKHSGSLEINGTLSIQPGVVLNLGTGNSFVFNNSITVPGGATLNIGEATTLTFNNGASLIINGTLNANGTSSDGITFDFITKQSGNGIKINSGATANIYYSDIQNAIYGVYFNSGTGTVDNSTIANCYYGVYVTSSTPTIQYCSINNNYYGLRIFNSYSQSWTARNIANNSITGNTAYGVYLYNSSPTLTYNTVAGNNNNGSSFWLSSNPILNHNNFNSNSNYGVACYGNASPSAYYNSGYSFGGYNNVISNGNKGIVVTSTSHPNFGNPGLSTGGYNSIYDNTGYEIDNSAPNFFACNNWWNNPSGPQPGDINGTVRTFPYLYQDPNPSQNSSESPLVSTAYPVMPDELQEAEYEMTNNNYLQATYLLRNYLIKHTEDNFFGSLAAVLFLKNLDFYLDKKGIIKEVESFLKNTLSRDGQFELLLGLSSVLSKDGNYNAALDYVEKLEDLIPTVEENNKILFQKAFINLFGMQDLDNVLFYLNKILERNEPNSLDYQLAMEEINSLSNSLDLMPKSNNKEASAKLQETFNLLDNYPNPFNPTTTIEYSIPEASFVELKIYDILGGEVASLVKENKPSGKHSVKFNASNLPSGIYFYRIVSGNFTATKKLILLK